jgi:hypothetical protein
MVDLDRSVPPRRSPTHGQGTVLRARSRADGELYGPPTGSMAALRLELGSTARGADGVLVEPEHRLRVCQHDGRIDTKVFGPRALLPDKPHGAATNQDRSRDSHGSGTRANGHAAVLALLLLSACSWRHAGGRHVGCGRVTAAHETPGNGQTGGWLRRVHQAFTQREECPCDECERA